MYTMYIDETGVNGQFTILSGVIIHAKDYNDFCERIETLLINTLGTNKVILKEIRRKYHNESIFTAQQYLSFEDEYYSLLNIKKPVFIISAVKNDWCNDREFILEKAYEHLLERFHKFLIKKGNNENGQLIYDKSEGYFKIIKEKHRRLIKQGSGWGWKFGLINDLFDKDDHECRALQIADLLGASVNSYLNNIQKNMTHFNKCMPFLDKDSNGNFSGYGFKIFP